MKSRSHIVETDTHLFPSKFSLQSSLSRGSNFTLLPNISLQSHHTFLPFLSNITSCPIWTSIANVSRGSLYSLKSFWAHIPDPTRVACVDNSTNYRHSITEYMVSMVTSLRLTRYIMYIRPNSDMLDLANMGLPILVYSYAITQAMGAFDVLRHSE